jgi:PAS domain S-box-containing protein
VNEESIKLELEAQLKKLKEENDILRKRLSSIENISVNLRESIATAKLEQVPFQLMVANVKDYAIFMLDPKGFIVSWNEGAQRIKQYTEEEIIGKHFSIFYTAEDLESGKPERELKIAIETGKYEEEGWRIKKDGTKFWANVLITAIFNNAHELVGFAKITRDLTERKFSEELMLTKNKELSASNSELEQFAYVASHDLQEPLRIVASYVQLLSNKYSDKLNDEAREYINFAYKGAQRMRQLINDLLEYSRVGRMFHPLEEVDMNLMLENVKRDIDVANTPVTIIKKNELPVIHAEKVYMRQLLQNLIGNAIKFHKAGVEPVIEISSQMNGDMWQFNIRDNGIGIDKKFATRIFSIFQRLHTREEYPGSGIGLSICKKIVEFHGGEIWVDSELDKGSVFHFTIPSIS